MEQQEDGLFWSWAKRNRTDAALRQGELPERVADQRLIVDGEMRPRPLNNSRICLDRSARRLCQGAAPSRPHRDVQQPRAPASSGSFLQ